VVVPRFGKERLFNEAALMKFLAERTNIPVSKLYCCFEDNEAVYLVKEYIEGVGINKLKKEKRIIVKEELKIYLETIKTLKSIFWGGLSGIIYYLYQ
jgi:serine/threonine protein kinase